MKSFHMGMTIGYIREAVMAYEKEGKPQIFVSQDGEPVSYEAALAHLDQMEKDGKELVPCCENCDETGRCLGVERKEPKKVQAAR